MTALLALIGGSLVWAAVMVYAGPPPLARLTGPPRVRDGWSRPARLLAAAAVVATAVAVGAPLLLVLVLGVGSVIARAAMAAHRRASATARRRVAVVETCVAVSASLRTGCSPEAAVRRAAEDVPEVRETLRPVLTAARLGGEVPAALRTSSREPGAEGLRRLAACWQVAHGTGAGLAPLVDRVAAGLRAQEAHRQHIAAQLAGPRATARLLAVLPAFGLLLGSLVGARPLDVLLGTPVGLACLAAGVGLDLLGLWWVEGLARRAEISP